MPAKRLAKLDDLNEIGNSDDGAEHQPAAIDRAELVLRVSQLSILGKPVHGYGCSDATMPPGARIRRSGAFSDLRPRPKTHERSLYAALYVAFGQQSCEVDGEHKKRPRRPLPSGR
jgi:hypothetical protein